MKNYQLKRKNLYTSVPVITFCRVSRGYPDLGRGIRTLENIRKSR